ncbi:O-antigen ligase family protein [Bacillus piscicola]|uniref:O-antigen ligase family protein n=1 Tax=Bacillus piscicola TaxID=1632684 RepID=UPI001F09AF5F|nr:O-antigen ligase family protein [Bacillus piscicola]
MTRKIFWFIFITSVVWGNSLPGIAIPHAGTLFPLRLILILIIIGSFILRKKLLKNTFIAKHTYFLWGSMIFYGLVTLFWAQNLEKGITYVIVYLTSFMIITTCIAFVKTKDDLVTICKSYWLNTIVIGVLAIYESISGDYLYEAGIRYVFNFNPIGLNTPVLFFNNINNLAAFMAMSIPICFIAIENTKMKILNKIITFLLCSVTIFLIDSRSALLSLLMFLILYLMYYFNFRKLTLYILLGALMTLYFRDVIFQSDVMNMFSSVHSDDIRLRVWKNTLLAGRDSLFVGYGPGNGYLANTTQYYFTGGILAIHNYFLEILIEFGLLIFVFFGAWLLRLFFYLHKAKMRSNLNDTYIYSLLIIFMIQFVVLSIGPSSMATFYFLWLILGLCLASLDLPNSNN